MPLLCVARKFDLHDGVQRLADRDYWLERSISERLAAVELLRRQVYGDYSQRLSRVCRASQLKRG